MQPLRSRKFVGLVLSHCSYVIDGLDSIKNLSNQRTNQPTTSSFQDLLQQDRKIYFPLLLESGRDNENLMIREAVF